MKKHTFILTGLLLAFSVVTAGNTSAQVAPSATQISAYSGLHAAAFEGDVKKIQQLVTKGANLEFRDSAGRTPVHVVAFASHEEALKALVDAGADINAFEGAAYDVITIAAVENDMEMLRQALSLGGNPGNITSPYEGTALIAAAHLGHYDVVSTLIKAGAPLDHVNNLGWTALIESIVLGDGGPSHVNSARALIEAGADISIADRHGVTPFFHATQRGYDEMVSLFKNP